MYNIAKNSDKEKIKELWAYAFNEQEPFLSEYFNNFWKAENAVILKNNEDLLIGALQMIPYNIMLSGKVVPSSYIVGVSVSLDFRSKGFSKKLMRAALCEQKKRREIISLLIPFSYEFYRKLGYRLCYTINQFETEAKNFSNVEVSCDIKEMTIDDFSELGCIYENFCKDKNGYVIRTKSDWEYIFFEQKLFGGFVYGAYEKDKLSGYISVIKSPGKIAVRELIYKDKAAFFSLLGFIASLLLANEKIEIRTSDDNILKILKEPKNTLKVMPTVMARVVDIPSVLSFSDIGELKINVTDDLIEENCGTYEKINDNVVKTNNENFDVSMDIGTLTELVLGFSSAKELAFLGLLNAEEEIINRLCNVFPKQTNYINHIMEE